MKLLPLVCLCLMARSETMFADEQGAAPKPYVITLRQTKDWALLQCEVRGAFPKPTVEWQDSAGNKFPGEEPQVSERGGSFYITLQTTVMKTDRYRCVATQEEIKHQIYAETHVYIHESSTGWIVAVVVLAVVLLLLAVFLSWYRKRSYTESPTGLDVAVDLVVLAVGVLALLLLWGYQRGSYTESPTGLDVAVDLVVLAVGVLALLLLWGYQRGSYTESPTGLDVAVDLVVLAVGVLALLLLWGYQREFPQEYSTEWVVAVLCTVLVGVLAVSLVRKWALHYLRGPRFISVEEDCDATFCCSFSPMKNIENDSQWHTFTEVDER
ncbi:uncharacterized protein LOC123987298 isoform X2 [Micropterus dolomieu]|uniref:uncharacterized protein LOC123987298 isoform X2 n=1 Tax=Micropterus dolomieu TaxID=147949 RepID=UPI001E8E6B14|nr:uncharacterized protein LOC123987298 isoform X2 [Micropterus dolomieu]